MEILRQRSSVREDLGLLSVLEVLESQEKITQRELARVTGLNLKKVNYCLHKLLEKGYVKFQRARKNPDKRTYLYILTPAGLKAKTQLTYRFLSFTLGFYTRMEAKLLRCLAEMVDSGVKRVVLYGASDAARILLGLVDGAHPEVVGVVDEASEGHEFHGLPVIPERQLHDFAWDGILITAVDDFERAEEQIRALGVPENAVWKLS